MPSDDCICGHPKSRHLDDRANCFHLSGVPGFPSTRHPCPCTEYANAAELAVIREASDVLWLGQDPAVAVAVLEAHLDAA
jgi:hypothetical protein